MRKTFTQLISTVLLGMLVLLTPRGVMAVDGEPQTTLETYAEQGVTACYSLDNLYDVEVSVRDFVKIKEMEVYLTYQGDIFDFVDFTLDTDVSTQLSGLMVEKIAGTSVDTLKFTWSSTTPTDIPNDATHLINGKETTVIGLLQFKVRNFGYNTAFDFATTLEWVEAKSEYLYAAGGSEQVLTGAYTDGDLTVSVTQDLRTITVTPDAESMCSGDPVNVTVEPAGFEYAFNSMAEADFSAENVGNSAPGDNYVVVKDENGCVSLVKHYTIADPEPVTFEYVETPAACNGGNGAIQFVNVDGGSGNYSYIVIPQEEIMEVGLAYVVGGGDETVLEPYTFNTPKIQRPAGMYFIAVQDDNGCVDLFDFNDNETIDESWELATIFEPFPIGANAYVENNVTCNGGNDGVIEISTLSGGIPFEDENAGPDFYKVSVNGGPIQNVPVSSNGLVLADELTAGPYVVTVMDSACIQTISLTVTEPYETAFHVDYDDVACNDETPDGAIWVDYVWMVDPAGNDTLTEADLSGYTFEVFDPQGNSLGSDDVVGGIVENLAPNYYSVVLTNADGCEFDYKNESNLNKNIVPLMDPEEISYDVKVDAVVCKGSYTGKITVYSYSGADNYLFSLEPDADPLVASDWQTSPVFEDLPACDTTVYVMDADNPDACVISQPVSVTEPAVGLDANVGRIVSPSCPGGNDGNATVFAGGGWPFHDANGEPYYEYALDNSPDWVTNPNFAVTEGEDEDMHVIRVKDSLGCIITSEPFAVDSVDQILISVYDEDDDNYIYCNAGTEELTVVIDQEAHEYYDTHEYTYYIADNEDMTGAATFVPENAGFEATPDKFGAGTYYIVVEDPEMCASEPVMITIEEGEELELVEQTQENATCYTWWDGQVTLKMTGGSPFADGTRYKYAVKNNNIFNTGATILWNDFYNEDAANDSTVTIQLQKGKYYIGVIDSCGTIAGPYEIEVTGYEEIAISDYDVTPVSCYEAADGEIDLADYVTGGNETYTYTLSGGNLADDVEQTTPLFTGLEAGTYTVSVTDTHECPADEVIVVVETPDPLVVTFDSLYVSCAGEEDGEITIIIAGGTGGTYGVGGSDPDYEEDGKSYRVVINNTDSEGTSYGTYTFPDDVNQRTFQVAAGEYEIYVYAADESCAFGPAIVTIEEPDVWDVTAMPTDPSDCEEEDGSIEVTVNAGGWAGMDYEYKLNDGNWMSDANNDSVYTFDGVGFGTHWVYVQNVPGQVWDSEDPEIKTTACIDSFTVVISEASPFTYTVDVEDVTCYGKNNGKFIITNVEGGNGTEGYQFQLVNSENPAVDEDNWLPLDINGQDSFATEFTFDTLAYGHHTLYIRDDAGYTLSKCQAAESWQIRQPDSLMITDTELLTDIVCLSDSTASFEIHVTGGTEPYMFAYTKSQVTPDPEHPYQNMPDSEADVWQLSPVFTDIPAGTYIAWVKDANGCDVVGGELNLQGEEMDQHRVSVGADLIPVVAEDVWSEAADCFNEPSGTITVYDVEGGNGGPWSFNVVGLAWDGTTVVDTLYSPDDYTMQEGAYMLEGLLASTTGYYNNKNESSALKSASEIDPAVNKYAVYAIDASGCPTFIDSIYVGQPEEFKIDLVVQQDAFVCHNDLSGIVDIITVSGGVAPFEYQVYRDGALVRNWTDNPSHVVQAGHTYKVVALDNNDCRTEVERYIDSPDSIEVAMDRKYCYGDDMPAVSISVTGEEGREYRVLYQEILDGDDDDEWIVYNEGTDAEWFLGSVDVNDIFEFDGEGTDDHHYSVKVQDDYGCESEESIFTFDPVTSELEIDDLTIGETVDCETPIEVVPDGGSAPYTLYVNDVAMEGMTATLASGVSEVKIVDSHGCEVVEMVEAICEMTIAEVQSEAAASEYVDEVVKISGTVSAIGDGEFYVQDDNAAWSGILIVSDSVVAVGDGVAVTGLVAEVDGVTAITDATVEVVAATLTVEAIEVLPEDVADEMYESVLVYVHGVRANAADSETGIWTAYTEETIVVTVDTVLYMSVPVEGHFYDVTGIVNGMSDAFYIEPRMEDDVVDLTETGIEGPITGGTIEFKVYPNPFDDRITIDNNDKLTRVIISNIAGQRVMDIEYPSHEIRTAKLVSGVYLIRMFTEEGNTQTKTMIKR
ncbi:T9SS type A sorting domain-containing protein [Maribellus maritimus]|uniref:T9SS type A sorting domain-containing protein n=1 Tax=Maribellus maritimus TaxID=2870838 RepID=UPI001EEA5F1E|nr:T9SS type A sorting domain-containing protein [Maribellus maritimus]MCG6185844.1 T9SS type A sorting domain-containing protein [Maribellus maritimus]